NRIAAHHIKSQGLARKPRRRGEGDNGLHTLGIIDSPGQRLMPADRAAYHSQQPVNAEMIEQAGLDMHHVPDGYGWEVAAVRLARGRVGTARPRGTAATAQKIWANHEEAIRIHALARPDHRIPPAGIVLLVVASHMRITADGVTNENRIVSRCVE